MFFLPPPLGFIILAVMLLLINIFAIVNIIIGFTVKKNALVPENEKVLRTALKFKIAFLPFFILHFIYCFIIAMGSANPFLMWTWIFIPIEIALAYIVLLSTSAYNISKIICLLRTKKISGGQCALHIILQLFFVADLIDNVILSIKERKIKKEDVKTVVCTEATY